MTDDELAAVDVWLDDLEPGCDGWYIEVALVRALRDEVERLRDEVERLRRLADVEYRAIKTLHQEIARLRDRLGEPTGMINLAD